MCEVVLYACAYHSLLVLSGDSYVLLFANYL